MPTYRTPGVYVEEISTLPPSVAEVATAIPAFIGYTAKIPEGKKNIPVRISSMLEFTNAFGGPDAARFTVTTAAIEGSPDRYTIESIEPDDTSNWRKHLLYYGLKSFFDNGGGSCYIVAVGEYGDAITFDTENTGFKHGLDALRKVDEPTLILFPDAVGDSSNYYMLCKHTLMQCAELKDRFGIFDVLPDDADASGFRGGVDMEHLDYGAAYTPFLQSSYSYDLGDMKGVTVKNMPPPPFTSELLAGGLRIMHRATKDGVTVKAEIKVKVAEDQTAAGVVFAATENLLTVTINKDKAADPNPKPSAVVAAWENWKLANASQGFGIETIDNSKAVTEQKTAALKKPAGQSLADLKSVHTAMYNQIKLELGKQRVVLPPSAAMAGIYARVDRERGVWKAPANVSVMGVVGPTRAITNDQQDLLNVDPVAGKSINVIRSFTGKGTLVWGARTLAGNDNEWRYVSVRRLFAMIEESIQKATAFAVFEPNDATTWLKVKAMIDSYLYGLWQQGALAGAAPENAYFVSVGLGKSMTTQDILEGRMIVEVGIAAVRPAEFIILRFSHKLQEA